MKQLLATLAASIVSLTATVAAAGPHQDLAFAVGETNHDKQSEWIIDRLVTFNMSEGCLVKLADKGSGGLGKIASDSRMIGRIAKAMTSDDWLHIESQSTNSKEANRAVVDKMIEEFKPRFHLTIKNAGACEVKGNALWLNYISSSLIVAEKYPPKSGKLEIIVEITDGKGFKADVNRDGTQLVVAGSRDIESVGWSDKIESALKRVSTKN